MDERLLLKYNSARLNLLIATALTVLNCLLIVLGINWSFFFSLASPQLLIALAPILSQAYMIGAYVLAAVIIAALVLCYVNSKDVSKYKWLIVASIILVLDSIFSLYLLLTAFDLFGFLVLYCIFDLIILAFILRGVFAGAKLQRIDETMGAEPYENPDDNKNE
ncbi:MAG: hypothetical protein GX802_02250 [Clostridiales bacterium]|nr:hypothetical protein [Clostridiales bacterium]